MNFQSIYLPHSAGFRWNQTLMERMKSEVKGKNEFQKGEELFPPAPIGLSGRKSVRGQRVEWFSDRKTLWRHWKFRFSFWWVKNTFDYRGTRLWISTEITYKSTFLNIRINKFPMHGSSIKKFSRKRLSASYKPSTGNLMKETRPILLEKPKLECRWIIVDGTSWKVGTIRILGHKSSSRTFQWNNGMLLFTTKRFDSEIAERFQRASYGELLVQIWCWLNLENTVLETSVQQNFDARNKTNHFWKQISRKSFLVWISRWWSKSFLVLWTKIILRFKQNHQKQAFRFFGLYGFWWKDQKSFNQADGRTQFTAFGQYFPGTNQACSCGEECVWKWGKLHTSISLDFLASNALEITIVSQLKCLSQVEIFWKTFWWREWHN